MEKTLYLMRMYNFAKYTYMGGDFSITIEGSSKQHLQAVVQLKVYANRFLENLDYIFTLA